MRNIFNKLKPVIIFLLPSVTLGALLGLYPGYQTYRYAWYDARFCTSCHVHDYASVGWKNSVHGQATTCHDCHHQRLRDYIRETVVMLTKRPHFPEDLHHTPYVKKELCSACHVSNAADHSTITGPMDLDDVLQIPKVDTSYLHKVHLAKTTDLTLLNTHSNKENERILEKLNPDKEFSIQKGEARLITCADCHGGPANRGHNFSAVDATCVRCHQDSHSTQFNKEYGCRTCHFQQFIIPFQNIEKNKLREKTIIDNNNKKNEIE